MKRYFVIACEIMFREVCHCAAGCEAVVDIKYMPKKLHDIGSKGMREALQAEIDKVDGQKYDAILLCYGLCNNGIVGLTSPLPIVVPRAHDCITLLMGSKERYKEYFFNNTGTYFKSPGWVERDESPNNAENSVTRQLGLDKTREDYIEQYGEDEGEYLYEMLGNLLVNYKQVTYIDTGVVAPEGYKETAKKQADDSGWEYDEVDGSAELIFRLLNGDWNEREFLVIQPPSTIQPSNSDSIICCRAL